MSKRNNQQNKQAARERLRAEREKQAKKEKTRRQLVVGGSIVAVLAVAGGIGVAIANMNEGAETKVSNKEWKSEAKKKAFAKPANTAGDKGTDVVIGKKDAKNTLTVYEDMRCPVCSTFEQSTGETLLKDIEDGKYKAQFKMGTFLDDVPQISGSGSKNALSALGAALNVSPDAFLEYKKVLFDAKNHPDEREDEYSDDKRLVELAQDVKSLKDNKNFEKAVKDGTYDKWALEMSKVFDKAKDEGITGTPAFQLNGKKLTVGKDNPPMSPEEFTAVVDQNLKK
ncbi:DsbA family protein [Streptomyces sp. AC563]|uniref:thioredoxin domain-containing protein n=2 Tax=Streptomyces buecherae TaxID=2763006 RepID=UPI00164EB87A|nr:thioredoxin domain-containing protein [Streptomyces buecherae]MBC3991794.1 DsbA family protein [Streptomyces buecherae]